LHAISDEEISVECRHTNLGPPMTRFLHYAFSSLGTPDTPFADPSLRNADIDCRAARSLLLLRGGNAPGTITTLNHIGNVRIMKLYLHCPIRLLSVLLN
jgi:hypothetical protein